MKLGLKSELLKGIFTKGIFAKESFTKGTLLKLLAICLCIVPTLIATFYMVPVADDFADAVQISSLLDIHGSYLAASLIQTKVFYFQVGGYFFAFFLNLFINPFLRWGMWGLRLFVFMVNVLLFVSLYFCVRVLMKRVLKAENPAIGLSIYVFVIFLFTNIFLNSEASFWYCGAVSYTLVLVILLGGVQPLSSPWQRERKSGVRSRPSVGFSLAAAL